MVARHLILSGLLALSALSAAACGTGDKKSKVSQLAQGCSLNSDCDGELVCTFGKCHAECQTSEDCEKGARCVKGENANVCQLEDDTSCTFTSECDEPLVCAVDSQCRNACEEDRDCIGSQKCVQSSDAKVCAEPEELDEGGNLVVPGVDPGDGGADPMPVGGTCTENGDCEGELICTFGKCHAQCAASADCSANKRCIRDEGSDSVCQQDDDAACAANADCPAPLVCGIDGQCRNTCGMPEDCGGAGQQCVPSNGSTVCADPDELDADGNLPGTPPACDDGAECESSDPCAETAFIECPSGACNTATTKADFESCGSGMICVGGACIACVPDEACAAPGGDACKVGAIDCSSGSAVCVETDDAPDDTACTVGAEAGSCVSGVCQTGCVAGDPCEYQSFDCRAGVTSCTTGSATCEDSGEMLPEGAPCPGYSDYYCYGDSCQYCDEDSSCQPENPCKNGTTSCVPTLGACSETTNKNNGTYCYTDAVPSGVCLEGACVECSSGADCVPPSNPCKTGYMTCTSGPTCVEETSNQPDGTDCGSGMICANGACTGADREITVTLGGSQTVEIDAAFSTVSIHLEDDGGTPITGAVVTITPSEGAWAPATVTTNASGNASFAGRVGRAPGTYAFELTAPGAEPFTVNVGAVAPSVGDIFTVVNAEHTYGTDTPPIAGTMANLYSVTDVVAGSDGTLYIAGYCQIFALTPLGELRVVAGDGGCGEPDGSGGLATVATLYYPEGLALDDANGILYFAEHYNSAIIRYVTLDAGTIDLLGGGGASTGNYGDGGPVISANFSNIDRMTFGPDGRLYLSDTGHGRLRVVDPVAQTVDAWVNNVGTCSGGNVAVYSCSPGCDVEFNDNGDAFILGYICAPDGDYVYGVLRRASDGTLTFIAGEDSSLGSQLDGAAADRTYVPNVGRLAIDSGGNLYYSTVGDDRVRRIDGGSGKVRTVAGTGTNGADGDYGPATSALLYNPTALTFDAADNLYIADTSNYAIRAVWGLGGAADTPTLSLQAGNTQTERVDEGLASLLQAKLVDGASANLSNFRVDWAVVTSGAGISASTARTASSGIAQVSARLGLAIGDYSFTASFRDIHGAHVDGSPVTFTATAEAPEDGTLFSLVNVTQGNGWSGFPGPGTQAAIGQARGVEVASDGTTYFTAGCGVFRLSPAGYLTLIAGSTSCSYSGDGQAATGAMLYNPEGLAIDEAGNRLFIADYNNDRIRVIDLTSNLISTYAGGGTATTAPYGDGGDALNATLNGPDVIALGSDGKLYISDSAHNRIRVVDENGAFINAFVTGASCGASVGLYDCNGGCGMAFDPSGALYISGRICAPGVNASHGVLRRETNGTFTHIAGDDTSANTGDGIAATTAYFGNRIENIALDSDGTLYLALYGQHLIRRISGGNIYTVVGTGSGALGANFVDLTTGNTTVYYPLGITAHPDGGVVFAELYNYGIRRIWGGL